VPVLNLDLAAYSLAEPGVTLVEPEPTPEPEFDLSGLTLLPLDAPDYFAPPVQEVREFETRGLSLMEIPTHHE